MESRFILAQFVSPALFYVGAGAVAAPILIHLLARRRFKRIRWAAIEFLIQAERRNRRRLRMEEWILLALRCLAVLLVALLIARPFLTPTQLAAGFGRQHRVDRVFVLDDSLSMGYQSAGIGRTSIASAKLAVRRLLDSIRQESPDDTVSLMRMSHIREPVLAGGYLDDRQTEELLMLVEAIEPTQRTIDVGEVVEGLAEVFRRAPDLTGAVVYFISDFQRHNWVLPSSQGSSDSESSGVFAPLVSWAGEDRGLRVVMVNVGDPSASNLAVSEVGVSTGAFVAGTTARLRANVSNYSEQSIGELALRVAVENVPKPVPPIRDLPARQSTNTELEVEFARPGPQTIRVELPQDSLPADNVRYLAADVASAIRIVLVNGEPSPDSYNDEVTFLKTALRPAGTMFSGNEPIVVDEAELERTDLTTFSVVVLANVYRLSDPVVEALERFVRNGGGLVVFLGDQVDPDLYSGLLSRGGKGLLPLKLGGVVRPANPAKLVVTDATHPALRGLSREGDPLGLSQVPFFQFAACEPVSEPKPEMNDVQPTEVGQPAGKTNEAAASSLRIIAQFQADREYPAIVERSFGLGRVVVITTTADKEWHLWPDHPTFVPVMIELMHHVAKRSENERELWIGRRLEIPFDPNMYDSTALLRTPGYPAEAEVSINATPGEGGDLAHFVWENVETAGVYQFVLRSRESAPVVRLVAVNTDPRESDLALAREKDLRRAFPKLSFEYFEGIDQLGGGAGETRVEMWRTCLLMLAGILFVEQGLAWFWGRRR
ncbi:MAG: BatA domain-containing protein [Planctomycetota bacterium]